MVHLLPAMFRSVQRSLCQCICSSSATYAHRMKTMCEKAHGKRSFTRQMSDSCECQSTRSMTYREPTQQQCLRIIPTETVRLAASQDRRALTIFPHKWMAKSSRMNMLISLSLLKIWMMIEFTLSRMASHNPALMEMYLRLVFEKSSQYMKCPRFFTQIRARS